MLQTVSRKVLLQLEKLYLPLEIKDSYLSKYL